MRAYAGSFDCVRLRLTPLRVTSRKRRQWSRGILRAYNGFHGADEGAHEFFVGFAGQGVHVEALARQEFAGVVYAVDACGLNVYPLEARGVEFGAIVVLFERARNAAHPQQNALADLWRNFTARDYVGDGEAAARLEDTEGFAQHAVFVGGKIDDAIGEDDVDRVIGKWYVFDFDFQELDVGGVGFLLVGVGEGKHLVVHVETVSFARRADAAGGEQDVDAAAGA